MAGAPDPMLTADPYVPPHTYARDSPFAFATAYPIVAYGAARVPALGVSLPVADTNTPKLSVTTHASVGGAVSEWQSPLHRKYPALHAIAQLPVAHVALPLPLGGPAHTVQLNPQCAGSSGFTHEFPHGSKPVSHDNPHFALAHVAVPFAGTGHAVHDPQCFGSVCSSAHVPLQFVWPAPQPVPQTLAVHVAIPPAAPGHMLPHELQLFGSLVVSTHPASHSVSAPQTGPPSSLPSGLVDASSKDESGTLPSDPAAPSASDAPSPTSPPSPPHV
jgi:hypothetical protein